MQIQELRGFRKLALSTAIISAMSVQAYAQETPAGDGQEKIAEEQRMEKIAVVGSKIGSERTEAAYRLRLSGRKPSKHLAL